MWAARAGTPDTAANRRVLDVVRSAIAAGFEQMLLAETSAEGHANVMVLLAESHPAALPAAPRRPAEPRGGVNGRPEGR